RPDAGRQGRGSQPGARPAGPCPEGRFDPAHGALRAVQLELDCRRLAQLRQHRIGRPRAAAQRACRRGRERRIGGALRSAGPPLRLRRVTPDGRLQPAMEAGRLNAVQPRSQESTAPVRLEASSEARNTTSAAISSGGWRPMAWSRAKASRKRSLPKMSAFIGVSTYPGQMAFTRMPSWPQPGASERVSPATPALEAAYASIMPSGSTAIDDAVLMIPAPGRPASTGMAYLQHRKTLVRFTRSTHSQSSSAMWGVNPSRPTGAIPALL